MLSLHGWTYFSTRIFVTCHVVKEIQFKNPKNCPYSHQFTVRRNVPIYLGFTSHYNPVHGV